MTPALSQSAATLGRRLEPGPTPLYFQLERDLRLRLEAGEFADSHFPTEEVICCDYGVSRVTVRRALDLLQAQGLIQRRRGARSLPRVVQSGVRDIRLTGSLEEFAASAGEMRLRIIALDERPAPPEAASLGLSSGELVCHLKVVSLLEDGPVAFFHIYTPDWVGRLIREDIRQEEVRGSLPIMRLIEHRASRRIVRMEQEIRAAKADREVAEGLGVARGTPIVVAHRTYFSQANQPLETTAVHYHPERYRCVTDFKSRQA